MKKLLIWTMLCALLLTGCGQTQEETAPEDDGKLKIVATIFPAYDFARAAAGELADVSLLLPPGAESHSYEPTPADILAVQECDLFVYLGGESDAWVDNIVSGIDMKGETLRMVDCVELLEEMTVEGMELDAGHDHHDHEHELGSVVDVDEHVWTSPENAAEITRAIGSKLMEMDPEHAADYESSTESYATQIDALDEEFETFFDSLDDKTVVFGDRFPLRYFAEEYDLGYYAAFPGCSTQTEPSAATIAFLTEKVKEEQIPAIFYIEFSNHLVADSIAEATGTKTAMFHTCHNISPDDLAAGETYLSLMQRNLETLKETLGN